MPFVEVVVGMRDALRAILNHSFSPHLASTGLHCLVADVPLALRNHIFVPASFGERGVDEYQELDEDHRCIPGISLICMEQSRLCSASVKFLVWASDRMSRWVWPKARNYISLASTFPTIINQMGLLTHTPRNNSPCVDVCEQWDFCKPRPLSFEIENSIDTRPRLPRPQRTAGDMPRTWVQLHLGEQEFSGGQREDARKFVRLPHPRSGDDARWMLHGGRAYELVLARPPEGALSCSAYRPPRRDDPVRAVYVGGGGKGGR
jgi:hypothetical protein